MKSYSTGRDAEGNIIIPAGHTFRLEPFEGQAEYPLTAYVNGEQGQEFLIPDERAFPLGPFSSIKVVGVPAHAKYLVTVATKTGERLPDALGTMAKPIKLFESTLTGNFGGAGETFYMPYLPTGSGETWFNLARFQRVLFTVSIPLVQDNVMEFFLRLSQTNSPDADQQVDELAMGSSNNHGAGMGVGWLQVGVGLENASTVRTASYSRRFPAYGSFIFRTSGLIAMSNKVMRVQGWGIPA